MSAGFSSKDYAVKKIDIMVGIVGCALGMDMVRKHICSRGAARRSFQSCPFVSHFRQINRCRSFCGEAFKPFPRLSAVFIAQVGHKASPAGHRF